MSEVSEAMMTELQKAVQRVVNARANAQMAQDVFNTEFAKWEKEYAFIVNVRDRANTEKNEAEAALRALTLAVYQDTGNKAPCAGVGIREVTRIDYPIQEAVAWAMEHKVCLQLDVKAFEKMVTASELRPGFVTVRKEPQATIAVKLG